MKSKYEEFLEKLEEVSKGQSVSQSVGQSVSQSVQSLRNM